MTVEFDLDGKVRNLPVSRQYLETLQPIISGLGPDIGVSIVSAGQHPRGSGGRRTGSTRHDVDHTGHAHTSDFVLTRGGKPIRPGDDPQLYARLIEAAAPHFPGIGHYEWGVHIGGGAPAFWGPDTTARTADPVFRSAYERGRMGGSQVAQAQIPREQLLQEAMRRGLIPREALLKEAQRRGLVPAQAPSSVEQTPDGPQPGQVLPEGGDRLANIRNVSPGGAALANLFLDPQQQTDIDDTLKLSLPQGATGGWSDEMMAWLQAAPKEGLRLLQGAFGDAPPSTFDQDYRRARTQTNVEQADLDRRAPGLSAAGIAAGALGSAAAVPSATALGTGTAAKVALGAGEGAVIGAGVSAGTADPGQRLEAAQGGAMGGAVLGAAGARAGVALERYLARRAAVRAAPSSEALKQASRELYEAAASSGVVYRPQPVADLVTDVSAKMADELIDPSLHPKASAVVRRLPELINKPATLKEVERYRQLASDAARSAEPGSADQRLATMIVEALDEFTLDQGNMVATSGGAELQREARKLWSQYRKDQLVAFQVEKAARRAASTGSGGNVNNAIRQNIRSILDNKKLRQGFTPDEIRAMEEIVRGAPLDSFLRLAGKLSPSGNGLMLALQTGGAAATGGLSLPLVAAGHMAKTAADSATTRRVKSLAALIRSGAKPPFGQVAQLSRAERRALAKLTAGAGGEPLGEEMLEGAGAFRTPAAQGR